jgi:catechol 2,3-dioxygenase-like lactoylglutathione lyase family enzyme
MYKIRHIALASDHPGQAADFYKQWFGFRELSRFGIPEDPSAEAKRPSGVFLTDGTINIAILKFDNDQLGKGLDFVGIHHFGMVVEDTDEWVKRLTAAGVESVPYEAPPGTHAELKFRGPDGVVFDITSHLWAGAEEVELPKAAE